MSKNTVIDERYVASSVQTAAVVSALLNMSDVHTATKYIDPKTTVRGTYVGKRDRRSKRHTIALSIGSPNYAERQFIKQCNAAEEPFPVRKVQLKFYPKKKK